MAYKPDDDVKIKDDDNKSMEKIQSPNDRRVQVVPYDKGVSVDHRPIIKCIGQMMMKFKNKKSKKTETYIGSGTVFGIKQNQNETKTEAYIITCAHNVIKAGHELVSVTFCRDISKTEKKWYPVNRVFIHTHSKYKGKEADENDLAIFKIVDDGFYSTVFNMNKKNIVHISDTDKLEKNLPIPVEIYGYPGGQEAGSKAKQGQKWGQKASFDVINGIKQKCQRNKEGTLWVYNSIDTEGGQSGSAIFISLNDFTYAIVGVHTGGDKEYGNNWGVALNEDKINWINAKTGNMVYVPETEMLQ